MIEIEAAEKVRTANIYSRSLLAKLTSCKWLYISDILLLLGHSSAKLSVVLLLRRLGRDSLYKSLCTVVGVSVVAWGVASTIAISVRCKISEPWIINDQCTNVVSYPLLSTMPYVSYCRLTISHQFNRCYDGGHPQRLMLLPSASWWEWLFFLYGISEWHGSAR